MAEEFGLVEIGERAAAYGIELVISFFLDRAGCLCSPIELGRRAPDAAQLDPSQVAREIARRVQKAVLIRFVIAGLALSHHLGRGSAVVYFE